MNLKSTLVRFKFIEEKNISDIKTPNLTLEKKLIVVGKGSGHGVGMSQWGAKYMASKGKKAEMILRHFYKGVK